MRDEANHALGRSVRQHLQPPAVATLKERPPTCHAYVPLMRPAALEGGAPRVVARKVGEETAEDSAIVIAAQIKTEKGPVSARRDEIQVAVQPRVGRRTHVHVLEQVQQAIPAWLVAP